MKEGNEGRGQRAKKARVIHENSREKLDTENDAKCVDGNSSFRGLEEPDGTKSVQAANIWAA